MTIELESANAGTSPAEQQLAAEAFELERQIKERVGSGKQAWWDLAEKLYEFNDLEGGYGALGYETLEDFLGQPEIGISRRTFFRACQLWRDLAIKQALPMPALRAIEPSKALMVRPAIMAGTVRVDDAFDDCEGLSFRDVKEKYSPLAQARNGQTPDDQTPLDAAAETKYVRCPTCGCSVPEDVLSL